MRGRYIARTVSVVIASVFATGVATGCGILKKQTSGSQVEGERRGTEIADASQETIVKSNDPSLDGNQVLIPAGSLATGTSVAMTPSDQSLTSDLGLDAASEPLEISATDKTGEPLTEALSPFTININLEGETALLPASKSENLCALLKGKDGKSYVWRRKNLAVDPQGKKVTFQSRKFGIYQMAYCANEELTAYLDAEISGINGSIRRIVQLSIGAGFLPHLHAGNSTGATACLVLDDQDGNMVASSSAPFDGASAVIMELIADTNTLSESIQYELAIDFRDSACDSPEPESDPSAEKVLGSYGPFAMAGADLIDGGTDGVLGADGPFDLTQISMVIQAAVDVEGFQPSGETVHCVSVTSDDPNGGSSLTRMVFEGTKIDGADGGAVLYAPVSAGSTYRIKSIEAPHCSKDLDFGTGTGFTTTGDAGQPVELSALGLALNGAAKEVCVLVKDSNGQRLAAFGGVVENQTSRYLYAPLTGGAYLAELYTDQSCAEVSTAPVEQRTFTGADLIDFNL